MAVPCRCNKRTCQARRSLKRRPEHYVYWPKCQVLGCEGRMYVDEYRVRGKTDRELHAKDRNGVACTDYRCDLHYLHRRGTVRCVHREEHKLNMSLTQGTHKHSPYKPEDLGTADDDCPF